MNIITDVNNLTKTVGDSIKEFSLSVVVNIGTPVPSSHASLALFSVQLRQSTPFIRTGAAMIFGVILLVSLFRFLELSYLQFCGRASQAIFNQTNAALGFYRGRLYIAVSR